MAGEKAKENKRLVANCKGCDKELSVELLTGFVQGTGRQRFIAAVCKDCLAKGWPATPKETGEPAEPADTATGAGEAGRDEPAPAATGEAG